MTESKAYPTMINGMPTTAVRLELLTFVGSIKPFQFFLKNVYTVRFFQFQGQVVGIRIMRNQVTNVSQVWWCQRFYYFRTVLTYGLFCGFPFFPNLIRLKDVRYL